MMMPLFLEQNTNCLLVNNKNEEIFQIKCYYSYMRALQYYNIYFIMQTQTAGYTKSKSYKKSQKASAKTLMKHSLSKLQQYYTGFSLLPNNEQQLVKIYVDIIQTTYNICLNIEGNTKFSIDIAEIICNNFILGAKVKYMAMFGGFIFVAQKLVVQGTNGALRALQSLKTMAIQDQSINRNRNEIILAIHNIKYLLLPISAELQLNLHQKFPKVESMIFNALISFSKIIQEDPKIFSLSNPPLSHMDLQQIFYHQCLKLIQISKLAKRRFIYKQIFGSYLRFISRHKIQPSLDLSKLLLDCLREEKMDSKQNGNRGDPREQDLTGFLVRKTFELISQCEKNSNFYIQQSILKQVIEACLGSQQVVRDSRNIIQMINTLFHLKKLNLFSNMGYWKEYALRQGKKNGQLDHCSYNPNEISNSITQKKNSLPKNRKEEYFFIISIYLYVQNLAEKYQAKVLEDDEYFLEMQEFSLILAENLNSILKETSSAVTPIWHYIVNNLHGIKTDLVSYCQKFNGFDERIQHFLRWSTAIEIQQVIVGNKYFQYLTKDNYTKYQFSNIYILLIKSIINRQHLGDSCLQRSKWGLKGQISTQNVKLRQQSLYKVIEDYAEQGILAYWDDLLIFGAKLFGMRQESVQPDRIFRFLSNLLKCKSMYFVAHKISPRSLKLEQIKINKYYRMSGFTNLLIQFLKLNQDSEAGQLGLSSSQSLVQKRRKLKKQKQKMRCDLMVEICNMPVKIIVEQIYPIVENIIGEEDRNLPFEELMGCFISLIPLIQLQMTISEKILFNRMRNSIVKTFSKKSMDKIRYTYHKNLAYMLRQFTAHCKYGDKSAKDQSKLRIIYSYIDSYKHLYSKINLNGQFESTQNGRKQNNQGMAACKQRIGEDNISFGDRKPGQNVEEKFNKQLQLNQMHNMITYVNFIQWIVAYCRKKQLGDILEFLRNNIQLQLQSLALQDNLMCIVNQFKSEIKKNDYWLCQIEILGQCMSKLIYLKSKRHKSPEIISNLKQGEEKTNETGVQFKRFNIQFEVQQSVIIINKLNSLIKTFSQVCIQITALNLEGYQQLGHLLEKQWDQTFLAQMKEKVKKWKHIRNFKRFIVVLNNILSTATNLGYQSDDLKPISFMKILLSLIFDTRLESYTRFSEMVFMNHLRYHVHKQEEIQEYLASLQNASIPNKQRQYSSFLIGLIALYMNLQIFSLKKFSPPSNLFQQFHLPKILFVLQRLQHIHPHKTLITAISGYIYQMRFITEAKLIDYNQCVLPMTNSLFLYPSSQINSLSRFQNFLEQSSSQLDHFLFGQILSKTMECLWLNNQLSQFRSSLRLSLMYFIRSNNVKGTLISLNAYQTRTKLFSIHQKQNESRKSQIIPVGANENKKSKPQFNQLDMLSLTDSFSKILISIYGEKFLKKSFQKYCNLIFGTNRRRTSMSFHLKFQSIISLLRQSIERCGQVGAKIFHILGEYTCKIFQNRKQSYIYSQYLHIMQKELLHQPRNQKNRGLLDIQLMKTFSWVKQQTSNPEPKLMIEKIRQVIRYSYYHAQILQNLLEELILLNQQHCPERVLSDEQIVELAVLFIDHNFQYKEMIQQQDPINCKNDQSFASLRKSVQISNQHYLRYVSTFDQIHRQKLKLICSQELPHPLTILYPFGNNIYIISTSKPLIVTKINRNQFDESVQTIETLIGNSSKILNDCNIDPKQWWKSRERVDRAMGRIVNELQIWSWDEKIPSQLNLQIIKKKQEKLWKLVLLGFKNTIKIQDIKRAYRNSYNQQPHEIDQVSRRISTFLKKNEPLKQPQIRCQNLVLLIHSSYTIFPFESILSLSKNRAVYRIPSFYYFYKHLRKGVAQSYINSNEANYLINSANDLEATEKNFYRIKQNFPQWQGVVGRRPSITQYFQLLDSKLFLFMGHGTGISHFKERQIYGHKISSFLMLFGCCSAALTQDKCEPNGATLSHLINESPGVLGCLWEVTDKDTDKVTEGIFRSIKGKYENLSRVVSNSKKLCKHQYLNGGALVIYGVPTYICQN